MKVLRAQEAEDIHEEDRLWGWWSMAKLTGLML